MRKRLRLTQAEAAAIAGVTRSAYANYETGYAPVPDGLERRLLQSGSEQVRLERSEVGPPMIPVGFPLVRMPYAGDVPASGEWGDPLEAVDFIELDVRYEHPKRFVTRIVGDSCAPALLPNDLAIWHADLNPSYNKIVLAQRRADHGPTVKQLVWDAQSNRPVLKPINPSYDSPADGEGWGVIARLVAVVRRVEGLEKTWLLAEGLRPEHFY
ncbi:MAG: LexA family transcriptional regulator [Fimbriimonadaceae bacterium]|nr:LexA family transcriptional regulator [Fimbriimonadaceae bacterium]QYK56637.1 MAG: LexA family transcriptional regulator [Fimbriimonadaceae bacterium]